MLYMNTPPLIEKVVMEHRGVQAVDDVVVYWSPPGWIDLDQFVRIDYYQVKFHVGIGSSVRSENLIDPNWTGTKHSMLWRFAQDWKKIRTDQPNVRLNLVTNWPWCETDPLAPLIRDTGKLHERFFESGAGSKVGKIRIAWHEHLSFLDEDEATEFLRQLRLCVRSVSQSESGDWLADRCQLAGLKRPDLTTNQNQYDDLAGRLLAGGLREFTPGELRSIVEREKLTVDDEIPYKSTCAIKSFKRFAHQPKTDAVLLGDLTDLFDGRNPVEPTAWSTAIPNRLQDMLDSINELPNPIQLTLDTHLSIGWYVGTLLDAKAGMPVLLRQKSLDGVELWDTSVSTPEADQMWQISTEVIERGTDVAIAISVTHDISLDVSGAMHALALPVGFLFHARLQEIGAKAIRSGPHACALATDLATNLRDMVREHKAKRTHVFASCPISFAFLLGQRSAACGAMTFYEHDFGGTSGYHAAMAT